MTQITSALARTFKLPKEYLDAIPDTQLVNTDVVRQIFGISRTTTYRLEETGGLPKAMRIGGSRRWRMGSLRDFLARREAELGAAK